MQVSVFCDWASYDSENVHSFGATLVFDRRNRFTHPICTAPRLVPLIYCKNGGFGIVQVWGLQWIWHWSYYPRKQLGDFYSYFVSNMREYILYLPISYSSRVQWGLLLIGSATKVLISSTVGDGRGEGYKNFEMLETFDFRRNGQIYGHAVWHYGQFLHSVNCIFLQHCILHFSQLVANSLLWWKDPTVQSITVEYV